jgi:hypothetical protein
VLKNPKSPKDLKVGGLYQIEIPPNSKLIFDEIEYFEDDIFMIVSKPVWKKDDIETWYSIQALVRDRLIQIEFIDYQAQYFKALKS